MSDEEASRASASGIDVVYWSNLESWTPTEFEWLALGFDPEQIEDAEPPVDQQPWRKARATIRRRFDRHLPRGNRALAPAQAVKLAGKIGVELPSDLVLAIAEAERAGPEAPEERSTAVSPRSQDLTALQRKNATLQKLCLILAMGAYGWDPLKEKPGGTVNGIVGDAERFGLRISTQTVAKHLQDAFESLTPQDEASLRQIFGDARRS